MDVQSLAPLGGTVVVVLLFLQYMKSRDKQTKELADNGHQAVRELTAVVAEFKTEMQLTRQQLQNICRAGES